MDIKSSKRSSRQSVFIFALFCFLAIPLSANGYEIYLGTEKSGSFPHFSGRMLCRTINSGQTNIKCTVRPGADQIDILTNLVSGSLDLAVIDSHVIHNVAAGKGIFQFLDIDYGSLAILSPLYDKPFTIIYRNNSRIKTLTDLKGKKVNAGSPGSMAENMMEMLMQQQDWTENDFELFEKLPSSQSQDSLAFCHGSVEAMVHVGVHPSLSVQRLLKQCKGRLLNLSEAEVKRMTDGYSFLKPMVVSAPKYPPHSAEVRSFGSKVYLLGSNDLDDETVQQIIRVLHQNSKRLAAGHPALNLGSSEDFLKGIGKLKVHAGAKKFFSQ